MHVKVQQLNNSGFMGLFDEFQGLGALKVQSGQEPDSIDSPSSGETGITEIPGSESPGRPIA